MYARYIFSSKFFHYAFPCLVVVLALSAAPQRGQAQVLYGSMVGNVKDSTGAVVPDAVVSITQVETNRTREATTDEAGAYTFTTIPSGTAYVPTMEAIETVNVVTNSFDAEQGLAGGSAVNVQIKSGTNNFHGSASSITPITHYGLAASSCQPTRASQNWCTTSSAEPLVAR